MPVEAAADDPSPWASAMHMGDWIESFKAGVLKVEVNVNCKDKSKNHCFEALFLKSLIKIRCFI